MGFLLVVAIHTALIMRTGRRHSRQFRHEVGPPNNIRPFILPIRVFQPASQPANIMKTDVNYADKTNFLQSLMHMIKGNFGTGILAMPASFAHCGLVNAALGLPILCLVAGYCVHLLVRSSQHLEHKHTWANLEYAELAKGSFKSGPAWMRPISGAMCTMVDFILIGCQLGICCVYLVFIVDNFKSILATYNIHVNQYYLFGAIMPVILLLSYIRTLKRLAIASAVANLMQIIGFCIIIEYLVRDPRSGPQVEYFRPMSEVALGFGSAMFAFEGIAVVLPVYTRMKRQEQMASLMGIINLSFSTLLALYFIIGLFGYLRFGSEAKGSITLNLPKEPLYDVVRAMFASSVVLTYPLQFYVANEIVWNWTSARWLSSSSSTDEPSKRRLLFDYLNRTVMVLVTFILAVSVPKLNLMMDFFGSISGTALSITLPPLIHLATFWEDTSGRTRLLMTLLDCSVILFGLAASATGSYFSLVEIVASFGAASSHVLTANSTTGG